MESSYVAVPRSSRASLDRMSSKNDANRHGQAGRRLLGSAEHRTRDRGTDRRAEPGEIGTRSSEGNCYAIIVRPGGKPQQQVFAPDVVVLQADRLADGSIQGAAQISPVAVSPGLRYDIRRLHVKRGEDGQRQVLALVDQGTQELHGSGRLVAQRAIDRAPCSRRESVPICRLGHVESSAGQRAAGGCEYRL